jgi:HD-like signal output (HDOD) protein
VRQARPLYTMPAVALEVLRLADDPRTDAARFKACIERDPALTTKLLRIVNSSLFGTARTVTDLAQAVTLLGLKSLKLLVLGFSLPERLFADRAADVMQSYWRRTLARAAAARELAETAKLEHAEEAFVCGLLADVGMLLLLQEDRDHYAPLVRAFDDRRELRVAEHRAFGFDHVELTLRLLDEWRLPESLIETIHAADAYDSPHLLSPTARIVRTADLLTALVTEDRADVWPQVEHIVSHEFHLSSEQLAELMRKIEEQAVLLAEALHVPLTAPGTQELTDAARHRLAPAAQATVADWLAGRHRVTSRSDRPLGIGRAAVLAAIAESEPPALLDAVREAASTCRTCRSPLTLCLIELKLNPESDAEPDPVWERLAVAALDVACREVDWPDRRTVVLEPTQRAVLLPRCDRRRAGRLIAELQRRFRSLLPEADSAAMKLSLGWTTVGLPPRGFSPEELVTAARRCLQAAHSAAGDAAKSIELY